jgi:hypothetical protein
MMGPLPTLLLTNLKTKQGKISAVKVFHRSKGTRRQKWIPCIGYQYSKKGMGHVDSFGANLVRIGPNRRNFTWRLCAFLFMLQASINTLYRLDGTLISNGKVEGIREFQQHCAREFIRIYQEQVKVTPEEKKQ